MIHDGSSGELIMLILPTIALVALSSMCSNGSIVCSLHASPNLCLLEPAIALLDFMPIARPERMRLIILKLSLCRMTGHPSPKLHHFLLRHGNEPSGNGQVLT